MKKRQFGLILPVLCGLLLTFTLGIGCQATESTAPVVSYGISVLYAGTDMAMAALTGNDIVFSEDCFARALNLSEVGYITVCSLPPVTDGELLLGSTRIAAGQSISGENLQFMTFSAAKEQAIHTFFTFTANGGASPMVCNLYLLSKGNATPTVSMASGLSLNVSTYRDLSVNGTLSAYDPDGDAMVFEIVSYPEHGTLSLRDKAAGNYIYRPEDGFVGSDGFSYVARDLYGNYSASAKVTLSVTVSGTSVTYADMVGSSACQAAMALTEAGIMSGTQVGNTYYFYPEQTVSRVEFLVMAMNAAGISDVPDCAVTQFADDADIPASMKGYVETAYTLGYVNGSLSDGKLCFQPNAEITRAQAAVILNNLLGLRDATVTPVFADNSEIPAWAREAVYSLHAAGIMTGIDGSIAPGASVTRAQSAQLLAAVLAYRG